jgi:hypothetical protein
VGIEDSITGCDYGDTMFEAIEDVINFRRILASITGAFLFMW